MSRNIADLFRNETGGWWVYLKTSLPQLALLAVLSFGFLYGLVYVYLIPPWQHHDEPTHFEYVWMIADSGKIPEKNAYDNAIRLRILESMKRNNFFNSPGLARQGEIAASQDPVWIGVTQVGDPPLYYWLAAQVLRAAFFLPIESQLYLLRLYSLLLLMGVLVTAWLFARELTPPNHPLGWLTPLTLALTPAFMAHNTALNNDVAAVLVYSLILLFGVRLIRRSWGWVNVAALLVLAGLSVLTKGSIWLAVFLVPLAFYFTAMRGRSPWLSLGLLALAALAMALAIFDFDDAALWMRQTHQPEPTRVKTSLGWAYQIIDSSPASSASLVQAIPDRPELHGGEVTLGAWMWGQPGALACPPALLVMDINYHYTVLRPEPVTLTGEPVFYTASFELPEQFSQLYLALEPLPEPTALGTVYFWRPVMVSGIYLANQPLRLSQDGTNGTWRGEAFDNLVRNSALTQTWPKFKPNMITLFETIDPRISEAANWVIYSLDGEGAGWYTRSSAAFLFNSFWGHFGWEQIKLSPGDFRVLLVVSVIGLAAGLVVLWTLPKDRMILLVWLAAACLCVLFFAWFTGISSRALIAKPSLPGARYIQPAAIPLVMAFSAGWYALSSLLLEHRRWIGLAIYLLFFAWLNIISVATIAAYFSS